RRPRQTPGESPFCPFGPPFLADKISGGLRWPGRVVLRRKRTGTRRWHHVSEVRSETGAVPATVTLRSRPGGNGVEPGRLAWSPTFTVLVGRAVRHCCGLYSPDLCLRSPKCVLHVASPRCRFLSCLPSPPAAPPLKNPPRTSRPAQESSP